MNVSIEPQTIYCFLSCGFGLILINTADNALAFDTCAIAWSFAPSIRPHIGGHFPTVTMTRRSQMP